MREGNSRREGGRGGRGGGGTFQLGQLIFSGVQPIIGEYPPHGTTAPICNPSTCNPPTSRPSHKAGSQVPVERFGREGGLKKNPEPWILRCGQHFSFPISPLPSHAHSRGRRAPAPKPRQPPIIPSPGIPYWGQDRQHASAVAPHTQRTQHTGAEGNGLRDGTGEVPP